MKAKCSVCVTRLVSKSRIHSSAHLSPGNASAASFSSFLSLHSNSAGKHDFDNREGNTDGTSHNCFMRTGVLNSKACAERLVDRHIDESESKHDQLQETGYGGDGFSQSFEGCSCSSDNEEFDDIEGEDGSEKDDNDFRVLDSYKKNSERNLCIFRFERDENEFRHPLVRETCRLIELRSKWNPEYEGTLRNLIRKLKPIQICAVLQSQADERVALNIFYWADRQWRYRHDPVVYYAMLEALSKTKLCQGAKRVLRLMRRRGIILTPEAFGYVMTSYSRAGRLKDAMAVLPLMQKAGIEPNLSICNTAIYVLVKCNKLDKARRFLERMQIVGIAPNVVTYNCLIKGYCDMHHVNDAIELIGDMPLKGCPPDKVSYYTVMSCLCKDKRIADVNDLMQKMYKDSDLLPDMVTYNTVIHMLSKHGHGDEALQFLRKAEGRGFRVDKVGYTAIVHSFCQGGRIDQAKELVNEMFDKSCTPDVVTYTAVIDGFCRAGMVDQARKMLHQMYKHGCKPNTVSYTAFLNGLCRSGNSVKAREIMNISEEEWWTPNAITYGVVMHGFRREGKLAEACDVAREMISKGFVPNQVEINLLIQSLCKVEKTNEAKKFLEECLSKGCAVNVVNFTTVIHGYCRKDDLEAALSLLDDMYLINKHPDAVTYTVLVDALARKGRIEEATDLIMKMLRRGILPTPVTYRTIIHRYSQNCKVEDLLKIFDQMLPRQPYRHAYNYLIEKLCSFGYTDESYKLLGKVLKTASRTDAHTCHVLMESYFNQGSTLLAYKVACRMFNRNLIPDLQLCQRISKRLTVERRLEEADDLMMRFVERGRLSSSVPVLY